MSSRISFRCSTNLAARAHEGRGQTDDNLVCLKRKRKPQKKKKHSKKKTINIEKNYKKETNRTANYSSVYLSKRYTFYKLKREEGRGQTDDDNATDELGKLQW